MPHTHLVPAFLIGHTSQLPVLFRSCVLAPKAAREILTAISHNILQFKKSPTKGTRRGAVGQLWRDLQKSSPLGQNVALSRAKMLVNKGLVLGSPLDFFFPYAPSRSISSVQEKAAEKYCVTKPIQRCDICSCSK